MVKRGKKTERPSSISAEEVDAICKLIDHAKKQGVRVFEGPAGIRFSFSQAPAATGKLMSLPDEVGHSFIP